MYYVILHVLTYMYTKYICMLKEISHIISYSLKKG